MSFTASEVIDEARDHHTSFDEQKHPWRVCLRALSRLVRRITNKVTELSEEALAVKYEVTYADLQAAVESGDGLVLPSHVLVLGNIYTWKEDSSAEYPVELVDYTNKFERGLDRFPAVMLHGSTLYPINLQTVAGLRSGLTGWELYQGLRLTLVRTPVDLTALTEAVPLPDIAKDALVTNLALWMASRAGAIRDLPLLPEMARDAEQTAINSLCSMDSTSRWTVART